MNEILEFIKSQENGVTEEILCSNFSNIKKTDMVVSLNTLIHQNLIEIKKIGNSLTYFSIQNKNTGYEALILSLIAQGGTSGLWLRDIKTKTNIPHNLVLKILKGLEDTRKIKSIKSVKNNRKTYVLYDVKPDEDVSGGVWFSNNDVDLVFVNRLMDIILQFVRKEEGSFLLNKIDGLVKMKTVKDFVSASRISEVELSIEDITTLIDCLVYDGRLEKIELEDGIGLRVIKDDYMKL